MLPFTESFLIKVTTVVANQGGKFIVRGGELTVEEGDWNPTRIAILEFGSIEQARAFIASPEFNSLNDIRNRSSNINIVTVDGA